jgi:hypothetical protein
MSSRKQVSKQKKGGAPPPLPPRKKVLTAVMPLSTQEYNATCDFCGSIFTPSQLSANQNINTRASYCNTTCGTKKNTPRYKSNIEQGCHMYAKGIFESIVGDIEKSPSINGIKTFDSLYRDIKFYVSKLYPEEYLALLNTIMEYEKRFGTYVDNVLNHDRYQEIAGSGYKPLITPQDYSAAISNLLRIVSLANTAVETTLKKYLGDIEGKKAYCKKQKTDCKQPCSPKSTLGIKSCIYNP